MPRGIHFFRFFVFVFWLNQTPALWAADFKTQLKSCGLIFENLYKSLTPKPKALSPLAKFNSEMSAIIHSTLSPSETLFDNPAWFDLMTKNPNITKGLLKDWYTTGKWPSWEEITADFDTRDLPSLLDPGIASYLEEFRTFSKETRKLNPNMSGLDLKKTFVDQSKTRRIYRALALNETQAKKIQMNGIQNQSNNRMAQLSEMFIMNENRTGLSPKNIIFGKTFGSDTLALSVSPYPEIAQNVAKEYAKNGDSVYLFELEVPQARLVEFQKIPIGGIGRRFRGIRGYQIGEQIVSVDSVESFIFETIPAAWIRKVTIHAPESLTTETKVISN